MAKKVEPKGRRTANRPPVVQAARRSGPGRGFWIAIGLVVVLGIGALSWVATRPKATSSGIDLSLPPMKAQGYVLGSPTAPVEVVEFADFECPSCGQYATLTEPDVRARLINTGKIRLRYMDFPLSVHKNTWAASMAAACANDQGKFWEMHDAIFANQDKWNGEATSNPRKVLSGLADGLKLDMSKYEACMDAETHRAQIQANEQEGERRGVNATPSFLIGGRLYAGGLPFDEMNKLVQAELAKAPIAPPTTPSDAPKPTPLATATKGK
jgi:protein-disulfide isomerase